MIINIYKVLHGDCFSLSFINKSGNTINLIVDTGFSSTYRSTLKRFLKNVFDREEKIHLIILTHTDGDHIGGIKPLLKDYAESKLIEKYWFNYSPKEIPLSLTSLSSISIPQGIHVRDFLVKQNKLDNNPITSVEKHAFHEATITILAPNKLSLTEFGEKWIALENSIPISSSKNDYDQSIEDLISKPFAEDKSPENKSSIAFLFEWKKFKLLFLSDSVPSLIIESLQKLGYTSKNKINVDYVKLSHHCSKFNTNTDLLNHIDCKNFIVSANGKNSYHFPHKETLAKVVYINNQKGMESHFIFNYDNEILRNIFTESEIKKYKIKLSYPSQEKNCYEIKLS